MCLQYAQSSGFHYQAPQMNDTGKNHSPCKVGVM